nr:hypothetical protein Hi04_10k_c3807_00004 [uncultured bacterium]
MKTSRHPVINGIGRAVGLGLGIAVTEAIAVIPSQNKKLVDAAGKPVTHIEGADRIGDHPLRQRHIEVVGPQVTKFAARLRAGVAHDFFEGMGAGATRAPGKSYEIEVAFAKFFGMG